MNIFVYLWNSTFVELHIIFQFFSYFCEFVCIHFQSLYCFEYFVFIRAMECFISALAMNNIVQSFVPYGHRIYNSICYWVCTVFEEQGPIDPILLASKLLLFVVLISNNLLVPYTRANWFVHVCILVLILITYYYFFLSEVMVDLQIFKNTV